MARKSPRRTSVVASRFPYTPNGSIIPNFKFRTRSRGATTDVGVFRKVYYYSKITSFLSLGGIRVPLLGSPCARSAYDGGIPYHTPNLWPSIWTQSNSFSLGPTILVTGRTELEKGEAYDRASGLAADGSAHWYQIPPRDWLAQLKTTYLSRYCLIRAVTLFLLEVLSQRKPDICLAGGIANIGLDIKIVVGTDGKAGYSTGRANDFFGRGEKLC
ncbi:hypothetical protein BC827DRAFT_1155138 [Russula dissimulans]|nr:hypothetical protein BC827DRAFT_1155138 [Russula dissimulans]